ncbi:MAG: T9SS type A sorting domain-containing protein [Putridiphycobacter sp.]
MISRYTTLLLFIAFGISVKAQSVQKTSLSAFVQVNSNDTLTITTGQSVNGLSDSLNVLQGYLPLQYSFAQVSDLTQNWIQIYPNPTSDFIYFKGNTQAVSQVKIFSSSGQLILDQPYHVSINKIKVSQFPKGIYFVHVYNEQEIISQSKIVIL